LTLASHHIFDSIQDWKVSTEHSFSDHRYIEFVLNMHRSEPKRFINARKTNWPKYHRLLSVAMPEYPPEGPHTIRNLMSFVNTFSEACYSASKAACPVSRPKQKKKPPGWSSDLRMNRRALFNKAKFLDSEQSSSDYKTSLETYKKATRRAKRISWHTFCSEIESSSVAARLRKILSKTNPTLRYITKEDQSWTTSS